MADFVLVHGAWHGAWCWRKLLPHIWSAGHRAFAIDLTGLGARRHLARRDIGLSTHVEDVLATLEAEELQRAVLVGHSYAGMVITGAADRAASRIGGLVYLDAVVPRSGESWSSTHSPATLAERRAAIAKSGSIAPPDPAVFGLAGEDREWVARRQCDQPGGCYEESLTFDEARWSAMRRNFIDCNAPALPTIAASRERVRNDPAWRVSTLATGHDPMISAPDELAALLAEIAATV